MTSGYLDVKFCTSGYLDVKLHLFNLILMGVSLYWLSRKWGRGLGENKWIPHLNHSTLQLNIVYMLISGHVFQSQLITSNYNHNVYFTFIMCWCFTCFFFFLTSSLQLPCELGGTVVILTGLQPEEQSLGRI